MQLDYVSRGRLNREIRVPENAPLAVRIALGVTFFVVWRLILAITLGLLLGAIWWGISPLLAIITGLLIFLGLPAVAAMMAQVWQKRAMVILTYLEQATRLNLPLARMLDAAQRSETPRTARRLRRLRDLLEDGAPLQVALPLAVPEFSERTVRLVAAGERLGNLRQTLAQLVRNPHEEDDDAAARDSFARWYPVLLLLVFSMVIMLVLFFVIPRLADLFKDFGMRLPYATVELQRMGRAIRDLEITPMVIAVVAVVSVMGGAFRRILSARKVAGVGFFDGIGWYLPVAHGLARDRGLADVCDTMAVALRAGYPLTRAIGEAVELRMNRVLQKRLKDWQKRIEGGAAADQAARGARLPALLCGMIGSGRGGDPAAAMEFLAAYYDGRFSRARELLRAASIPVLALVFGSVVLFMASGMYLPILQLMDQLSDSAMKVSK